MNKTQNITKAGDILSNKLNLLLTLFLLWSLSIAQPIMRIFGEQPVFLVAHEIRGWLLIALVLALNFIPAILLWLVVQFPKKVSIKLSQWIARAIIVLLLMLYFLPMFKSISSNMALSLALVVSIIMLFAITRLNIVVTFIQWFSAVSLYFIISFLFISPTKQLLPSHIANNNDNNSISRTGSPFYIFIFDELPLISLLEDEKTIDKDRFPAFAQLAKGATWFPNTTAISSATAMALPAILTGMIPSKKFKVGSVEQYPQNLFTEFAKSHSIHAIEVATKLCPTSICQSRIKDKYKLLLEDITITYLYHLLPKDKLNKLPPINDRWTGYLREINQENTKRPTFSERKDTFMSFIDEFKDYPENTLHVLHILLPHAPWRILPDLKLYGFYEKDGTPGELPDHAPNTKYKHQWTNDSWATQLAWQRHLLQTGAADKLLANAIAEIKRLGQYNDATIMVVSDHGSAFIPDLSRRFAHDENVADIGSIPFFIKFPNQKVGKKDPRNTSNLDVTSTLFDINNIEAKNKVDGISLYSNQKRLDPSPIFQEGSVITNIQNNYKDLFDKSLNNKLKLFGKNSWKSVYEPHDTKQFINKSVNDLIVKNTIENSIQLYNANLFNSVVKDSQYLPIYYRLNLLKENTNSKEILVALNDKLVSHCYLFIHAKNDCAGIINPENFKVNNNTQNKILNLRFFSVINGKNTFIVEELMAVNSNLKAQLITENKSTYIDFEDGNKQLIQTKGAPFGTASIRLINNGTTYTIEGWAADTMRGLKADKILVFIDDKLFAISNTGVPKPYLIKYYGFESMRDSGFQITIPFDQFPHINKHHIRVFAQDNSGRLTELNYSLDKKYENLNSVFKNYKNREIPKNKTALYNEKNKNIVNKTENPAYSIDVFNINQQNALIGDWYNINNHTRWIGASVDLVLPNNQSKNTLHFDISAKPFLVENKINNQKVLISINGNESKEFILTKKQNISFDIDVTHINTQSIIISIEMPNAVSPASISDSRDIRLLSLIFSQFTVILK